MIPRACWGWGPGLGLGLLLLLSPAGMAEGGNGPGGVADNLLSNRELLLRAGEAAVLEALENLPLRNEELIGLQPREAGGAASFWEGILVTELTSRGFRVMRLAPLPQTETAPTGPRGGTGPGTPETGLGTGFRTGLPDPGGQDATGTTEPEAGPTEGEGGDEGDSSSPEARAEIEEEETPEEEFAGPLLLFETVELSLSYPRGHGGLLPGGGYQVERLARAGVFLNLEGQSAPGVEWVGRGSGVAHDRVPYELLAYLEACTLPVESPSWERKGLLSRLVEPGLVVGIVGGLVYLFYANRAEE